MHSDNPITLIVVFEKLSRIIEPDPCNYLSIRVLQLYLGTIGLITRGTSIE